jgi:hypothetical protein
MSRPLKLDFALLPITKHVLIVICKFVLKI